MMVLALSLGLGIALGLLMRTGVPVEWLPYVGVIVLAALDSCLGGVRAALERTFNDRAFLFGFATNTLMAGFIVWLGDRIGVRELYLAAVVAFGVRMFDNLSTVRKLIFERQGWE